MKKYFVLLSFLLVCQGFIFAQAGTSCDHPLVLFPAANCENTAGEQYSGKMQCLTADCSSYFTMSSISSFNDPLCSEDDERKQSVVWIKVRATSDNFTINNGSPYIGSGAAAANTKDYTVYSGTCSNMMQIACHTLRANTSAEITGLQAGMDYFILASPAITQTKADAISICITGSKAYEAPGNSCDDAVQLTLNNTYTFNNSGATADGPESLVSIENNTWYKWVAPSDWIPGQAAYVRIIEQVCNSSKGLQILLWNTENVCPENSDRASLVGRTPGVQDEYYYQWTPVANRSYYISVDGYAGTACQFRLEIGSQSVMPVNLMTLDAKSNGNHVILSWVSSEESNNSYFTIEKSRDGQLFIPLLKVEGAGKSTTERTYTQRDEFPFSEVNYYRLKQTDFKGNYTYSKSVAVNVKGEGNLFHTSCSTGRDKIDVDYFSPEESSGILRIYNQSGNQMYNMNLRLYQGHNDYKIKTHLFPEGKYLLKLETPAATLTGDVLLEEE